MRSMNEMVIRSLYLTLIAYSLQVDLHIFFTLFLMFGSFAYNLLLLDD